MPKTLEQSFEEVAVDALRPHPRNPRQGDVGAISESIEANGFYGAVVAQRSTGRILAGNHRWKAAKAKGMQTVPVLWLDVSDDRAVRILLADNRVNDLASYDTSALAEILSELANTSDLAGTGYDGDDLDEIIGDLSRGDGLADAMGGLASGDKEPFRQMTFTVHDSQFAAIQLAIDKAKAENDFAASPNQNGNGNALWAICEAYGVG